MTVWLLGILGVGVLDVVVLHFTEHTRLHANIKTVCAIIFVFAIIYPLPGLISGDITLTDISFEFNIELDDYLTEIIYDSQISAVESALESALAYDGYTVSASITADITDGSLNIYEVLLCGSNYNEVIIELAAEYLSISKEIISFVVSE